MARIELPFLRRRSLETLSHSALSAGHLVTHRTDIAIVFNAANAPFIPLIRAAGIPVIVHVDGLEWKRAKWSGLGRFYYQACEAFAVRSAAALIADAVGIQEYYLRRYGAKSEFIAYGAPIIESGFRAERLSEMDLKPRRYHLVVARMEPENHVAEIVNSYLASSADDPLVVIGSVPYPSEYEESVRSAAASDSRVRLLGSVWDQKLLDALYANCTTYLHGHSVGGTNPSLLRAMGAASAVIAWDVEFNREVLGDTGRYFREACDLATEIEIAEQDRNAVRIRGELSQVRAAEEYRWDAVADKYASLAQELSTAHAHKVRW